METAVRRTSARGVVGPPSRLEATTSDATDGSAHSELDTEDAAEWGHALVDADLGQAVEHSPHVGAAGLATRRPPAPPAGAVHAFQRPRVREQSRGHYRSVSESPATRRRLLRG